MKKLLLILLLYILVEGETVVGDGLYVYHRGSHAVDKLTEKVDEYYPKIQAIDTVMSEVLSRELSVEPPDTAIINAKIQEIKRQRKAIRRD